MDIPWVTEDFVGAVGTLLTAHVPTLGNPIIADTTGGNVAARLTGAGIAIPTDGPATTWYTYQGAGIAHWVSATSNWTTPAALHANVTRNRLISLDATDSIDFAYTDSTGHCALTVRYRGTTRYALSATEPPLANNPLQSVIVKTPGSLTFSLPGLGTGSLPLPSDFKQVKPQIGWTTVTDPTNSGNYTGLLYLRG